MAWCGINNRYNMCALQANTVALAQYTHRRLSYIVPLRRVGIWGVLMSAGNPGQVRLGGPPPLTPWGGRRAVLWRSPLPHGMRHPSSWPPPASQTLCPCPHELGCQHNSQVVKVYRYAQSSSQDTRNRQNIHHKAMTVLTGNSDELLSYVSKCHCSNLSISQNTKQESHFWWIFLYIFIWLDFYVAENLTYTNIMSTMSITISEHKGTYSLHWFVECSLRNDSYD